MFRYKVTWEYMNEIIKECGIISALTRLDAVDILHNYYGNDLISIELLRGFSNNYNILPISIENEKYIDDMEDYL